MFNSIEFLTQPRFQDSKPGLQRIKPLMQALNNPENSLKFVHVAGTNGKGSTCAYMSNILIESGYKTGMFTSPYIWHFEERIKVNNEMISISELNKITYEVKSAADSLFATDQYPTEFELYTAIAFLYFKRQECDVVVCEVGMGGLHDSTNIIPAKNKLISVITSISIDHTNYLGDKLENIATEKAGIICENTPVVSAQQNKIVTGVLQSESNKNNVKIEFLSNKDIIDSKISVKKEIYRVFKYRDQTYKTRLLADYQPQNCSLAILASLMLSKVFPGISDQTISNAVKNTYWPVRFELVSNNPFVIIDGSHNIDGVKHFISTFKEVFGRKKSFLIVGFLADKQYSQMVKKLSTIAKRAICIQPPNPRALKPKLLESYFNNSGVESISANSLEQAVKIAKESTGKNGIISCVGSLYSAGQLSDLFKK